MQLKLIMLPQPILVSDEIVQGGTFHSLPEKSTQRGYIKANCFVYDAKHHAVHEIDFERQFCIYGRHFLVIASNNPEHKLPSIDFSLLSQDDCKNIGWIDVKALALDNSLNKLENHKEQDINTEIWISGARQIGFVEGYNKYEEINGNKISLSQFKEAISLLWQLAKHTKNNYKGSMDLILDLFNSPKIFEVEVEMKVATASAILDGYKPQPKIFTDNNTIKIIKINHLQPNNENH